MKVLDKEKYDLIDKVTDYLINNYKKYHLTCDTGTVEDGWVVVLISCKKKDLIKNIKMITKEHKAGYPIREG